MRSRIEGWVLGGDDARLGHPLRVWGRSAAGRVSRRVRQRGRRRRGRLFGVTVQTMNNPFFLDLEQGLKEVIEAHGDRLVMLDAQFNSLKQKNDISDLLQQQPAALFINPVNWEGVRGSLIEAKRKNVPVIIVDAPGE